MNPLDIQYELKKQGVTQVSIARELGLSEMSVSLVIRKRSVSDRVMKAVSAKIKKDHRAVFPEHYFSDNRRDNHV